ncbi:MAG: hypothetical protein GY861_27700 [bacterium]|nr:hypothetical protein [bacterium]
MNKNLIIYLALIIALVQLASADSEVYSGWVYSGDSISTQRQSFIFYLGSSNNEIIADYGTGSLFVRNNSCEFSDTAKVCLNNVQFEYSTRVYKMNIELYILEPSITLTRTILEDEVMIGEDITVDVTISNDGHVAKNMIYTDSFTDEFEIVEYDGVDLDENTLRWEGELGRGETIELSYEIKAKEITKRGFKASLSYFDGFTTKTIFSEEKTIEVLGFFNIDSDLGKEEIYYGETTNLTLNVSSDSPYTTLVNYLEITADEGIKIKPPSKFTKIDDQNCRWSGSLLKLNSSRNVSKFFKLDLTGLLGGTSIIRIKAEYVDENGIKRIFETKEEIKIITKGVAIRSNLEDETLESYQRKLLKIYVQNLNPYTELQNVEILTDTELTWVPDMFIESMGKSEQVKVIERYFYAPEAGASSGYKLRVNVSYELGEDNFTQTYGGTLTVIPIDDIVITQTATDTVLESGGELFFSVNVRNPRLTGINSVKIYDEVPGAFEVVGTTSKKISIDSAETMTAYTYKVVAPRIDKTTVFYFNTTAEYSDLFNDDAYSKISEYTYDKQLEITVKPEDIVLSVEKVLEQETVYESDVIGINYIISNPTTDKPVKNLVLSFPLQQEFDLVDSEQTVTIDKLNPGERVYVNGKETIRAKYNGTRIISKTRLDYENDYGEKFNVSSNSISQAILSSRVKKGPFVIVEKSSPKKANNTDKFTVEVTFKNIGDKSVSVDAYDGEKEWSVFLTAGSEKKFTYEKLIHTVGSVDLSQVVAEYSYDGKSYKTGSNTQTVDVVYKPVISIEKKVPVIANTVEKFTIEIELKNLIDTPIKNVTIMDDGQEWNIPLFTDEAVYKYEKKILIPGRVSLGKATATYEYMNATYEVESDSFDIEVLEKKMVTLKKEAPNVANEGAKFKVVITAKNNEDFKVEDILLEDGDESWIFELGAYEEKTFEYSMSIAEAGAVELPKAEASYVYNGENFKAQSNTKDINVASEPVEIEEEEPEGFFAKILHGLKKILTWKRR